MHRIAICLILLCASQLAFGRDARPSGEVGDCRDSVITVPSPAPATAMIATANAIRFMSTPVRITVST